MVGIQITMHIDVSAHPIAIISEFFLCGLMKEKLLKKAGLVDGA
jgi:hypothetical protein